MHTKPPRKKFVLRLPIDIHNHLANAAHNNRRSMNAEIIHHLEHAFLHSGKQAALSRVVQALDDEFQLLSRLRNLAPEKRIAMAALLEVFDL